MDTKIQNPISPTEGKPKIQPKMRPRHIPQRMCVACRTRESKRGLVHIVRTPDGKAEVDETGKRNGRGAYLCRTRECWEVGLNRRALDNALKIQIDPENRAHLKDYGEKLPGKSVLDTQEPTVFREGVRENAR